jgi:hypothetical protein
VQAKDLLKRMKMNELLWLEGAGRTAAHRRSPSMNRA